VTDIEFSHAQLQAALTQADKEIRKLTFGKRDTPLLVLIRRVLRDARTATRCEAGTVRVKVPLAYVRRIGKLR